MSSSLLSTVLASSFALLLASVFAADETLDARYPFRTDFANAHLPWYQPKPLEFPPHHSDRRIIGELVSADFIHRTGQFRMSKTGELVDFTIPAYGAINYLNAEADLRDVPLGTFFLFFLNQDANGGFTQLATMQDQFTMDAGHSFSYRLDEVKLGEGKLLTTKHSIPKKQDDLGKKELLVTPETRVWKGDQQVKLEDLKTGDELLYNLTGKTAVSPGHCTDLWIGAETHQLATEQQRKKFSAFTKTRGLPGWIEKTEGKELTVTLFSGDARSFKAGYLGDLVVGKEVKVAIANDELRTWNPPVDGERGSIVEVQKVPEAGYGCSGVRLVMTVGNMLEGFRAGRIVRVFGPGWPAKDQFFGESLMGYGYGALRAGDFRECMPKEYPAQFPFRTDYGNSHLPWYQVQEGVTPPRWSAHVVFGELVKADAATRSGQFRNERTGELVDFTLLNTGATLAVNTNVSTDQGPARFKDVNTSVRYRNADAPLADLPPGQRYRFHLYQDARGDFTRCSLISDEFSHLALNSLSYRITSIDLKAGTIGVAWQHPQVKNYNGDMEQPSDFGRSLLRVTGQTHVWKDQQALKLTDLKVGDALLINLHSEQPGQPGWCSDLWVVAGT